MTITPRALRDAAGVFATGVTIVTTRDGAGNPVGFTANSFASVSLDPPLVSFNLARGAHCFPVFAAAPHFAINVLASGQEALSNHFAGRDEEKWRGIPFTEWMTGSPILEGVLASFDCECHARFEGGDHVVFLGKVVRLSWQDGDPLLFFRGAYRELAPKQR